jgi:hypothetical protein
LGTESPDAAKTAVDWIVVLVVDVDVDEKPANAGSQVFLTTRTLANIFVHVHDHVHDDVHVHVRWNLLKAARLKARGFDRAPVSKPQKERSVCRRPSPAPDRGALSGR